MEKPACFANFMRKINRFRAAALLLSPFVLGCGSDESNAAEPPKPDLPAGSTALVVLVNPVVNTGHFSVLPKPLGTARNKISVDAQPGGQDTTSSDGLALLTVDPGPVDLGVGGASLSLTVQAKGDVYDAPIAQNASSAAFFVNTPIRYPIGDASSPAVFQSGAPMSDIQTAAASDFNIIVLQKGTYTGNLTVAGKGVMIYGEGFKDRNVNIEGSITATGEGIRLRGLNISGDLNASGNDFGISFSQIRGSASITGDMGAFIRNIFCGQAALPSNPITLLDNYGIEPLQTRPSGTCSD